VFSGPSQEVFGSFWIHEKPKIAATPFSAATYWRIPNGVEA
jgi:G:T-mismatch repair DNA endonuclease (very short patch repair protein)